MKGLHAATETLHNQGSWLMNNKQIFVLVTWVITLKKVHAHLFFFLTKLIHFIAFSDALDGFSVQKEEVNLLLVWLFGSSVMVSLLNFNLKAFHKII